MPSASRADSPGSITWVIPRERGLPWRAGRSRKSGDDTPGNLTAVRARERGRRLALDVDRDRRERALLPLGAQQAEHVDVVVARAVAVPVAQHALVAEADAEQRLRRLHGRCVRERAETVQAQPAEREPRDDRLRLAVGARAPEAPGEPRPDDAAQVAPGELRQPRHAHRPVLAMDDEEVELRAALPLAGGLLDVRARLV